MGQKRRLEHRGLRVTGLRRGGDDSGYGSLWQNRIGCAQTDAPIRRQALLHRQAQAARCCGERTQLDVLEDGARDGTPLRRGHHQLPAAPRNREFVRRQAAVHYEERSLDREHCKGQDLRQRGHRRRPEKRSAGWLGR
jgi:hypothetical protein